MKISFNRETIKTTTVILLVTLFGIFYWQTIMYLPLFGDATIHGQNAKELLTGGWRSLRADYPGMYYSLMDTIYVLIGEKGFNLIPFTGLIFLLISTYLLVKQFTKSYFLSLLSIVLLACSPKIIFYSARMYQEILISAVFIFSIFLLFKYLETKVSTYFYILVFIVSITLATKQQSLFILFPTLLFFLILKLIKKDITYKKLLLFIIIPIITALPFYGVLFHNKGVLQPGSDEFPIFRKVNEIGKTIFYYKGNPDIFSKENQLAIDSNSSLHHLNNKLNNIEQEYSSIGYQRSENRHIWPTEVFTNFTKFNQAHNLYLDFQGIPLEVPFIQYIWFILIIASCIYLLKNYKSHKDILVFSAIFLPINYILFSRNTDQQRYHLFLPIFMLCLMMIVLKSILSKYKINKNLKILVLCLYISITFIPIITSRIILNKWWENSQIYSSSTGGIQSVKEVGDWINQKTNKNDRIGQQCGNETQYYSDRNTIGDWRIYFLEDQDLREYFKQQKIKYYVINESQVVEDNKWQHICWMPSSFQQKMDHNFQKVFETTTKDIFVYEI